MKPIKLVISAIGPYAGKIQEIEFDVFEEKGIFLISGDTGAGKTTIFDAICFALYGTTSGTYRDKQNLRSEYADDSVQSYVDFYFSHQGRDFHIFRQPPYERQKRRGTGIVAEKEKAVLYEEGAVPLEGVKQVNSAVKELLHIDEKQFKQIAMIAQGEFWELLNAKTDQRTEILRTIFSTGAYKNIEYRLKDRMDASQREKANAENSIIQYFKDVSADEGDELFDELEDMKSKAAESGSAWNLDELLDMLDRLILSDRGKLKHTEKELKKAEAELKENDEKLATAEINNGFIGKRDLLRKEKEKLEEKKAEIDKMSTLLDKQKKAVHNVKPSYYELAKKREEVSSTRNQIKETEAELEAAVTAAKRAEVTLAGAKELESEADELKQMINSIDNDEHRYQRRDELEKRKKELEGAAELIGTAEANIKADEISLREKIETLTAAVKELKGVPGELIKAKNEKEKQTELLADLNAIIDDKIPERETRKETLSKRQNTFLFVRNIYEKAREESGRAERIFEENRAGILAEKLVEGEKCPVCGSLHHPEPAELKEASVSEEELRKLREDEAELREKKDDANAEAERAKISLEEFEDNLRTSILDSIEDPILNMRMEGRTLDELIEAAIGAKHDVAVMVNDSVRKCDALDNDRMRLEKAEKDLETAQGEETEALRQKREHIHELRQNNRQELAETTAELKTLEELKFPDWETAERKRAQAETKKERILADIRNAEEVKKTADNNAAAVGARLDTLKDRLDQQEKDRETLSVKLGVCLNENGFSSAEEMLKYMVDKNDMAASENMIDEYRQAVATNEKQLSDAEEDAAGKTLTDIEALTVVCDEQRKKTELIRKRYHDDENRMSLNEDRRDSILIRREGLEKARRENTICQRLYHLVRGTTGNGKITLEQYIQAAGFDGIIAATNRRLLPMSDGQYELYRSEEPLDKKSNNFLDLEVLDNFTGHRRPVGSLSGGESFKASLSLALGLSDTVASNLGGVQMDALFIDEGFGTLDRKSIDSAMEILMNLTGTNKLVGIISHREELIENIPQQIRVMKTKDGSRISIENGL